MKPDHLNTISIVAPPNTTGKHRSFHLDRMIVRRIFQSLNEQFDGVANDGASNTSDSSRKNLAILTAFISESLRKLNPFPDIPELTRKKMNLLRSLEQAINNGISVRPVADPAGEKPRTGISSKIAYQLDYSISLIDEMIRGQTKLNSCLEHSESI
uniref:Uncharacterized protein n=1 Tax=Romanomermis culicivorax TaxID=13658 RepID=A0A915JUH6_ROMCU